MSQFPTGFCFSFLFHVTVSDRFLFQFSVSFQSFSWVLVSVFHFISQFHAGSHYVLLFSFPCVQLWGTCDEEQQLTIFANVSYCKVQTHHSMQKYIAITCDRHPWFNLYLKPLTWFFKEVGMQFFSIARALHHELYSESVLTVLWPWGHIWSRPIASQIQQICYAVFSTKGLSIKTKGAMLFCTVTLYYCLHDTTKCT